MLKIHLDTSRLSDEELANVSRVLRCRCAECIEDGVPVRRRHTDEVFRFLDGLATAIDRERDLRSGQADYAAHEADSTGVP